MLRLVLITKNNIDEAIVIQNKIFPDYDGKNNYLDSLKPKSKLKFYMIYDDDICVGITGIYSYDNDNENAWLGFFGIKEEYRYKGYGYKSLLLTEEYAKNLGFKYMRLFTDKEGNDYAIEFYKRNGYIFEDYDCDLEKLKNEFNVVIGSKSLTNDKVTLWNNRFINLTKQTKKQMY